MKATWGIGVGGGGGGRQVTDGLEKAEMRISQGDHCNKTTMVPDRNSDSRHGEGKGLPLYSVIHSSDVY